MEEYTVKKSFGKWHDFVLLFFGFILTSLFGSLITYYVQSRNIDYQNELIQLQTERQKAEMVFTEISNIMDKRVYRMRKIIWGYRSNDERINLDNKWRDYENVLEEWNLGLNKNLSFIQIYFGKEARMKFESVIHKKLKKAGYLLQEYKKFKAKDDFDESIKLIDQVNEDIYKLDIFMLEAISNNRIGKFHK